MLLSMTGHGSAVAQDERVQVLAEIRAVNNRFLKITVSSELDAEFQAKTESLIRERIQRGAVNVRIQMQFLATDSHYQINRAQLESYRQQLGSHPALFGSGHVLTLPGVVVESIEASNLQDSWPTIESAIKEAMDTLIDMRIKEGQAMLADLSDNCDLLAQYAASIKVLAPNVVDQYASRITDRINRMLEEYEVSVSKSELIKEVGLFAERVDVSEELVRLASHVDQFREIANGQTSNGRKLDFLTQELLRETNTIGSKANHAQIANLVVEMKTVIERIREMIQNVE